MTLLVVLLIPYVRSRYSYFSEVSFQLEALKQFGRDQVQQARSTCTDYVTLYPQRRIDGAWPDPVCARILRFTDDMGYIAAYLRNYLAATAQTRDGVWLPVDYSVKGPAIALTRELAGGRIASTEPPDNRAKRSAAAKE